VPCCHSLNDALPIFGKRPLIKVALHRSVGIVDHMTILRPCESRDVGHIVHSLDEIKDELLPVPAADKVYFRALELDQLSIEADKIGRAHSELQSPYE